MTIKTVLVTGANRGIGLSFCRKYLHLGWKVYGTYRTLDNSSEFQSLYDAYRSHFQILILDVASPESIVSLQEKLKGVKIDLLINNAGIYLKDGDPSTGFNPEFLMKQLQVNAIGPLLVTQSLLSNLTMKQESDEEYSKVINITSRMGSIGDNDTGKSYGYRASKAALNMYSKTLALDFKNQNLKILVGILHPGYIQTDMTNLKGDLSPDEAVERMTQRIHELNPQNSGKFLHRDGQELPW